MIRNADSWKRMAVAALMFFQADLACSLVAGAAENKNENRAPQTQRGIIDPLFTPNSGNNAQPQAPEGNSQGIIDPLFTPNPNGNPQGIVDPSFTPAPAGANTNSPSHARKRVAA